MVFFFTQKVIIAGRSEDNLKKTVSEVAGLEYLVVDVSKVDTIAAFVEEATKKYPEIDCVISK